MSETRARQTVARLGSGLALALAAWYAAPASPACARQFEGVTFADQITVGQTSCALMGVGVREKYFVDVYYGGLYLSQPSRDAAQVVASDQAKCVLLHVVYRQVDAEKWVEGWKEGFGRTAPHPEGTLAQGIETFLGCFSEPVRKGEEIEIRYVPGAGTDVTIRGQKKATIAGADFMQALWGIWFGKEPASKGLMTGMLGK